MTACQDFSAREASGSGLEWRLSFLFFPFTDVEYVQTYVAWGAQEYAVITRKILVYCAEPGGHYSMPTVAAEILGSVTVHCFRLGMWSRELLTRSVGAHASKEMESPSAAHWSELLSLLWEVRLWWFCCRRQLWALCQLRYTSISFLHLSRSAHQPQQKSLWRHAMKRETRSQTASHHYVSCEHCLWMKC
jgi:hypothetical protein